MSLDKKIAERAIAYMTRRDLIRMLIGTGAAALSGCSVFDTRTSYRFKMIVDVETLKGLARGSSVYEVKAVKNGTKLLADERAGAAVAFGEAVVIPMPDGSPLFMLADVPGNKEFHSVVTRALVPTMAQGGIDNFIAAIRAIRDLPIGYSAALPPDDWPVVVRFRNLNDPTTVEEVDPSVVGIQRVMIKLTSERPMNRIRSVFPPWFARYYDGHKLLDGSDGAIISVSAKLPSKLSPASFTNLPPD